jgi:8-oxo-dGTP pyrophosphatase MutT (NUDIX family)
MQSRVKQFLARRQIQYIVDPGRQRSAVLIPIYRKQGQYYILLTKRTQEVKNHRGQISFPGGAYQEEDGTLLNTALRESYEEIGLRADDVDILGEMDDFLTQVSNYIISPFVAVIPWPYEFKLNSREIEELIEVPISALLEQGRRRLETRVIGGEEVTSFFYWYQGRVIWGATARILSQLLDIIAGLWNADRP